MPRAVFQLTGKNHLGNWRFFLSSSAAARTLWLDVVSHDRWTDTHIWKHIQISECWSSRPSSECFCDLVCWVAHRVFWLHNTTSVPTVNKTINPWNRRNHFFSPNYFLSTPSLCQKNNKHVGRQSNIILIFLMFISEKKYKHNPSLYMLY